MDGWVEHLNEGRKYLSVAIKTADSKKFTTVLRYNLAAIALEKYVMAACMINDYLPENHTLTDLMDSIVHFIPIDLTLKKTILQYEDVQMLCSLDDYQRQDLTNDELFNFIESVNTFCTVLDVYCNKYETAQV
jgi:hypothetical protein